MLSRSTTRSYTHQLCLSSAMAFNGIAICIIVFFVQLYTYISVTLTDFLKYIVLQPAGMTVSTVSYSQDTRTDCTLYDGCTYIYKIRTRMDNYYLSNDLSAIIRFRKFCGYPLYQLIKYVNAVVTDQSNRYLLY